VTPQTFEQITGRALEDGLTELTPRGFYLLRLGGVLWLRGYRASESPMHAARRFRASGRSDALVIARSVIVYGERWIYTSKHDAQGALAL
jgi:hypothetical protein